MIHVLAEAERNIKTVTELINKQPLTPKAEMKLLLYVK
jgi:hypothetical protein